LPPDPELRVDDELMLLLSDASIALGRLDGAANRLPNPDLFVAMYVRQEAVLSSQIEGTQSTLQDVLQYEIEPNKEYPTDVREVVNYVNAIDYGLGRLEDLPLSLRLLKQIHAQLMKGTRGGTHSLGMFRDGQNHVGPPGSTLANAKYVPPPVLEMHRALADFEKYLHQPRVPPLIHCALAHAQFETIHPFWDGNGRVGRLLITFLLCHSGALRRPLLYLSHYLKLHRTEYYDRLMDIRNKGDWEGWLKFFLAGVLEVSTDATTTADAIMDLRERHRNLVVQEMPTSHYGLTLLDCLFEYPVVTVRHAERLTASSYYAANKTVQRFVDLGLLTEVTGRERDRVYQYDPYLDLFAAAHAPEGLPEADLQTTNQ
jgi:Fic family protein